ncbi:MAG: FHA domain-containing protein, partial [Bdellovibrionota bacterium]
MGNRHAVFHVTLLSGVTPGKKTVQAEEILLGRVDGCDLVLDHKDISRKHLSVKTMYGQVVIEDLGSSNGTFLNGAEIKAKTPTVVGPNDIVSLGRTVQLSILCEWSDVAPPPLMETKSEMKPTPARIAEPAPSPTPVPAPVVKATPPPPVSVSVSVAPARISAPREETMPKLEIEKPAIDFDSPLPRAIKQNERLHQEIIAARAEAKRLLSGAQKQAATMVQEAERLAEIKTQGFYERARQTEAEAEELYRMRTEEAHQDAQKFFDEARAEAQQLIVEARERSQGLREQAEKFASEHQKEAHRKMGELVRAGETQARELVAKKTREMDEYLARRESEIVTEVLTDLKDEIEQKRLQVGRELEKLEREAAERVAQTEARNRELVQSSLDNKLRAEEVRRELDQFTGDLDQRRRELTRVLSELEKSRSELRDLVSELEKSRSETVELRTEVASLREARDKAIVDN